MADNTHDENDVLEPKDAVTVAAEAAPADVAPAAETQAEDSATAESSAEAKQVAEQYAGQSINSSVPQVKLEDELKQSFIDYAMSVIVDRALPDVRDGLKPVHRRVLYDMYDLKIWHNVPTKKSARVVGDVIGRFHPHGDAAVYDTIVRMAQWFSMRAPLIFGQGNFGNLDGDSAAAMRYTEVRMTKIAEMMLQDIDKETVNTYPNYDGNEQIPEVLPTRFPNLLVNGSSGIAVGLATNIPPHNLGEVIDGTVALLDNPDLSLDELMTYIPGPDFPTGGLIISSPEIKKAYATGRGRCLIRARTHSETDKQGRTTIYVDEIPYMVNKSAIVKEIADLVREKKIEGIAEVNDLSDKDNQVRIAIDLKRDAYEEAVLNNLYQHTSLQSSFSFNVIALVNNHPKQLSLIEILQEFLKFRREVVTRRTVYLLRQDRRKAFLDEGLIVAKSNIQRIIDLVTSAANSDDARQKLMAESWDGTLVRSIMEFDEQGVNICLPLGIEAGCGLVGDQYHLSDVQARAILALQLNRLTHLATEEIQADYQNLKQNIHDYLEILNSTARMNEVIRTELLEAKATFKDPRRSSFVQVEGYISKADLISRQAVLITLSHQGYIKYQDLSVYEAMNRGTKGNAAAKLRDEDYILTSTVCNSHDNIMCFTNLGRCFVTKVYELPTSQTRTWRGRPIQNLFELSEGESVRCILPLEENLDLERQYIIFATAKGGIKRSKLSQFASHINRANGAGIKSISLEDGDELVQVALSGGEDDIILFSSNGRALRFCEYNSAQDGAGAEGDDELEIKPTIGGASEGALDGANDDSEGAESAESESDDGEDDDEGLSDAERIKRELNDLQRYLAIRKSGAGLRAKGRAAGTQRGMKLQDGATLAGMIVVPAAQLEDEKLNYIMITKDGMGKRGRIISLTGKVRRGSQGINCISRAAKSKEVVGVILVHEDSDYLVFSNTGSVLRSRVGDITARSRVAGVIRFKRLSEGEDIVGLQDIAPEVVVALNETAEARAEEKRRQEQQEPGAAASAERTSEPTSAPTSVESIALSGDTIDGAEQGEQVSGGASDLDFEPETAAAKPEDDEL